ncbi:hypothetical protein HanIR_Chr09g0434241 [Helianthus annuus]|nr:hypothetical protein HanIR_Chr09g0434241 [Helianthus annuus]
MSSYYLLFVNAICTFLLQRLTPMFIFRVYSFGALASADVVTNETISNCFLAFMKYECEPAATRRVLHLVILNLVLFGDSNINI